jgi:hypothetical protein
VFDQVPGEAPLTLLPPASDREGNIYVLFGSIDQVDVRAWIGAASGGWAQPFGGEQECGFFKSTDFGVHGWVGFGTGEFWYWSSNVLVRLADQACTPVLSIDPATGTNLSFRAVIPFVRETPSRTDLVAWIQSPTDRVPYQVLVDLRLNSYTVAEEFSPDEADEVDILGVGHDRENELGVVVVRYVVGDSVRVHARFLDHDGKTVNKISLDGLAEVPQYGIAGYLQASDQGLFAGLLSTGELVVFDQSGGRVKGVSGIEPVGVHRWEGRLWLVGMRDGSPAVAEITDDGSIGDVQGWDASRAAASALPDPLEVVDDRRLPAHTVTWKDPRNAVGPAFFVSPHSLDRYADGTTQWLVAGPSFDFGGEPRTSVAVAPVGVSYP